MAFVIAHSTDQGRLQNTDQVNYLHIIAHASILYTRTASLYIRFGVQPGCTVRPSGQVCMAVAGGGGWGGKRTLR